MKFAFYKGNITSLKMIRPMWNKHWTHWQENKIFSFFWSSSSMSLKYYSADCATSFSPQLLN